MRRFVAVSDNPSTYVLTSSLFTQMGLYTMHCLQGLYLDRGTGLGLQGLAARTGRNQLDKSATRREHNMLRGNTVGVWRGGGVGTLIKKKTKFSSLYRKLRWDQVQSHTVYEEGLPNIRGNAKKFHHI